MSNIMLDMIDSAIEQLEQENEFKIDNDQKAEWALAKIKEEKVEAQRFINVCNSQILYYQSELRKVQEALQDKTGNLQALLFDYFYTVPHKATKTQETYKLPSGTLKLKHPSPEFKRDDEALVKWLKDRDMKDYIKTIETPQWGELKKLVQYQNNFVCFDGEVIEGVILLEKEPVFEVEV